MTNMEKEIHERTENLFMEYTKITGGRTPPPSIQEFILLRECSMREMLAEPVQLQNSIPSVPIEQPYKEEQSSTMIESPSSNTETDIATISSEPTYPSGNVMERKIRRNVSVRSKKQERKTEKEIPKKETVTMETTTSTMPMVQVEPAVSVSPLPETAPVVEEKPMSAFEILRGLSDPWN